MRRDNMTSQDHIHSAHRHMTYQSLSASNSSMTRQIAEDGEMERQGETVNQTEGQ